VQKWRVIGLDSTTGKGRDAIVEAATEHDAQIAANDLGIMVERVVRYDVDKPKPETQRKPAAHSANQPPVLYEPIKQEDRQSTFKARLIEYSKFKLSLPLFSEKRRGYEERGVNTVGEIAAGVFFGMLIFTCFSPLVIFFALAFWYTWLTLMAESRT
tara:strand:+ start:29105 stop:29575 length:471 start_codon:yes stop_codon:yes gene_type:complete